MPIENGSNSALFEYCLWLGDNSLILGHRLSEWCGHGPILEEDIAMTNIALDLVGQSRTLLSYAGEIEGKGRSEDDLAYLRDGKDFRNSMLVEQPNGDFGKTMVRQFLFDVFNYHLYVELTKSKDEKLAAIAEKSLKEITYHLRHSSEWIKRLGDGTDESHEKTQNAIDELWMFTDDLFEGNGSDKELIETGIAPSLDLIKPKWMDKVKAVFEESTLKLPAKDIDMMKGSRGGTHTDHLDELLTEMQVLPRTHSGAKW